MTKKDHDTLITLCEKADGHTKTLEEIKSIIEPIATCIQRHEESIAWLKRGLVGAYAVVGTALIGLVFEIIRRIA